MVGLCTAMMLARDGHQVTVLERDEAPADNPEAAWEAWDRRGVNQFRLLHFLLPRARQTFDTELPDVLRGPAGGRWAVVQPLARRPPRSLVAIATTMLATRR